MKSLLLLALLAGTLSAQALFQCRFGVQPRREWRKLDDSAKKKYIKALRGVMKRPNPKTPSFFDTLVKEHMDYGSNVHGFSPFFPWHRYMLAKLEQELQKSVNVMLPYWDWGFDSQAPEKAPIWGAGPLKFGSNGNKKKGCVKSGAFANHKTFYPNKHCLRRRWSKGKRISALVNQGNLQGLITANKNYNAYREAVEEPHGIVHAAIGGDMLDPTTSPNDPVFYLHHANVDRLWWKWQAAYPQLASTYEGKVFGAQSGVSAASTDQLTPYNAKVSDVFNTENLCYRYIEENLGVAKVMKKKRLSMKLENDAEEEDDAEEENGTKKKKIIKKKKKGKGKGAKNAEKKLAGAAPPIAPIKTINLAKKETPSSDDRSDLTKIRVPDPLPIKWIKANNLNENKVRANEKKLAENIMKSNAKGTVVDGALWTRPGVLTELINDGAEKFHADVGDLRVEVKAPDEKSLQGVLDMKERIRDTLEEEGKDEEVKAIPRQ